MKEQLLGPLPTLLPLLIAFLSLLLPEKMRKGAALIFLFAQSVLSAVIATKVIDQGAIVASLGGWSYPFGIYLLIDLAGALMLFFTNLVFLIACGFGLKEEIKSSRLPLIFLLQMGANLSLSTADFFNLFVAFELMMAATFALFSLDGKGGGRDRFNYIQINILAGFLLLSLIGALYAQTGQLNIAAMSAHLLPPPLAIALVVVFGFKAGLFPFYFWLPSSYPLLSGSLRALFGGVLTKVAVFVLIRMTMTLFGGASDVISWGLLILAGPTMLFGVLGALSKETIGKILSYHILSQVGYMALGIGLMSPKALSATLYFIFHNMLVKSSLFLIGQRANNISGSEALSDTGGLIKSSPFLAIAFGVQALSLAGFAPLSGFFGKLLLFKETASFEHYLLFALALLTSFLTLASMCKIWSGAFFKKAPTALNTTPCRRSTFWIAISVAAPLALAFFVEPSMRVLDRAADDLFHPERYRKALELQSVNLEDR